MDTHNGSSSSPEATSNRMGTNGEDPISNPTDAFRDIGDRLAELKSFAGYFLAAKMDGMKVGIRNAVVYAALGIVGLLVGGTIIVMAAALLVLGIAHGLAALFGGMGWLGDLVTGLVILGIVAAGVIFGMRALTNSSRKRTVEKYEHWQHEQRQNFGTDVEQAAHGRK